MFALADITAMRYAPLRVCFNSNGGLSKFWLREFALDGLLQAVRHEDSGPDSLQRRCYPAVWKLLGATMVTPYSPSYLRGSCGQKWTQSPPPTGSFVPSLRPGHRQHSQDKGPGQAARPTWWEV